MYYCIHCFQDNVSNIYFNFLQILLEDFVLLKYTFVIFFSKLFIYTHFQEASLKGF